MHNFWKSAAVTAAALALAAGAAEAKTLKMAYDADPVTLDIHEQLSGGVLQLSHMVCDPLVRWNKDLGFDGRLAEKWERQDGTTVRFFLRKGVKFHSGREMTADDVVWTLNRLKKKPRLQGHLRPVQGNEEGRRPHRRRQVTDGPFPLVIHNATYIFPLDSKFYEGKRRDRQSTATRFASKNISCTGPFTVASRASRV